jgi:L-lactate dehydrogenase complex protein LldG
MSDAYAEEGLSADAERAVMARLRGLGSRSDPGAIDARLAALPTTRPEIAGDLAGAFTARLTGNGATVEAVADRSGAIAAIASRISALQPQRRLVTGHDARLAALPWRDGGLLPRFGTATPEDRIAVSYAHCGIAETGALCLWVDRNNPALNSLLCDHHIVLVDRCDLRATLEQVWDDEEALHTAGAGPRGLMLVAGPSSTADIAMELVTGAHGPITLHVIMLGSG